MRATAWPRSSSTEMSSYWLIVLSAFAALIIGGVAVIVVMQ